MSSQVYKFFTQGDTAQYREAMSRAIDSALYEQFKNLNNKNMLEYIKERMKIEDDFLIVPISLLEEMENDLKLRGLYYAAIVEMMSEYKLTIKKLDFDN